MDTRLEAPAPRRKGVGGWEKKTTEDWTRKDEEARVNLTRNAPDEKRREPTTEKTNCMNLKKIWKGRGVIQNTYIKIPHQSDEGAKE